METRTVSDIIQAVKDITGLDNLTNAKAIRWMNYATDSYSYLAITASGRWQWDSSNQNKMRRMTTTIGTSDSKILLESDTVAIERVEVKKNGKYRTVYPIDIKDDKDNSLSTTYETVGTVQYYDYDGGYLYLYPTSNESTTVRVTPKRAHPRYSVDNLTQALGVNPLHEEYITLYTADRLMIGSKDTARIQIRNELMLKTDEIKELFSKRDQDTPRKLKAKIPSTFMGSARP